MYGLGVDSYIRALGPRHCQAVLSQATKSPAHVALGGGFGLNWLPSGLTQAKPLDFIEVGFGSYQRQAKRVLEKEQLGG